MFKEDAQLGKWRSSLRVKERKRLQSVHNEEPKRAIVFLLCLSEWGAVRFSTQSLMFGVG